MRRLPSGAALMLAAAQALAQPLPPPLEGDRIGAGWRVATLPAQKPPVTRFDAASVDGRTALRVGVDGSYGNLVLDLAGRAAPPRLSWSWRVDRANAQADLRLKSGDDSAIKVCLSFDLPLAQVPFVERQLLRVARARSGQDLPAATLCWAYGHDEPVDQVIENPYSRRVRTLVLRGRADGTGRWHAESRDVAADWRRAFGDEAPHPPPLQALGVAGDGDNTGARSLAWLADLRADE